MPDPKLTVEFRNVSSPDVPMPSEAEQQMLQAIVLTFSAATKFLPDSVTLDILVSLILTTIHDFENPQAVWAEVADEVAHGIEQKRLGEQ